MFENLKNVMAEKHIKAFSLAKQAEINPSDLYSALKGKRELYPNWRKRISKVLDVPEEQLFEKEGR